MSGVEAEYGREVTALNMWAVEEAKLKEKVPRRYGS